MKLDEKLIEETVAQIDDRIKTQYYSNEQIIAIIDEYIKMDLLGMQYQTREAILYMLSDVACYYDVKNLVNWQPIISIRGELEDDLKEYIDDIIETYHN